MGPTTPSTTGRGTRAPMGTPPGKVSRRPAYFAGLTEGRGLTDLMAPTALARSWLRCHGPSLSNRAAPPPRSCNTTGYSTNAGVRVPCWKRRLREAHSAVNLWFAAGLLGWLEGGECDSFFSPWGGHLRWPQFWADGRFWDGCPGFVWPLTRGSKLDPSSHAASRLGDAVTTEMRDSPSDPTGLEDGSSHMPPSPTLVIFRGVCDVGVTSPSLLLSLDSLRLGLRGRCRRRFSDPDDCGELPREDGVGVRGPDLGGTPFPAGPSSSLTGIALPTGPQSPESFREASGPGPLLPSIASFHTHTADVAQTCRNFTLGLFALPPPHSTPERTMH